MPSHPNHYCKNLWENCAKVIASKTDEELEPYLCDMFDWLEDINWPGGWTIFDRLTSYQENKHFARLLKEYLNESACLKKDTFHMVLKDLESKRKNRK